MGNEDQRLDHGRTLRTDRPAHDLAGLACKQRGGGKPHHPIRILTDTSWWCTFCGTAGIPAPEGRKAWE